MFKQPTNRGDRNGGARAGDTRAAKPRTDTNGRRFGGSAASVILLALAAAALLAAALTSNAGFQPGTSLLPKKAAAAPAGAPPAQASGGRIAFVSGGEIYAMNADGSGVTRLTNIHDGRYPSWSPDGRRIAFESNRDGNDDIYAMNADGSGVTRLTNTSYGSPRHPSWSPDSRRIAFVRGGDIYAMNADGSGVTRLTNLPDHTESASYPSWSPDGRRIAFDWNGNPRDRNRDIYAMNADGSGLTRLTNRPKGVMDALFGKPSTRLLRSSRPSWSPDGRRIAFESGWEIYAMNADGSGLTRLTNDGAHPSWGPAPAPPTPTPTITPTPTPTPTITPTPTPRPDSCPPDKPCVALHVDRTTVDIGEPINLTLAAVNDFTLPDLTIQMVIEAPTGWSVSSAEMTEACAALCSITFQKVPAGGNRSSRIQIFPNETGDFSVRTTLKWFNGEETETNIERLERNIEVKVNPKPSPTPTATPAPRMARPVAPPPAGPSGCGLPQGGAPTDIGWLLMGLALPGLAFSGRLRKRAPFPHPNKPSTPSVANSGGGDSPDTQWLLIGGVGLAFALIVIVAIVALGRRG